MPTYDSFVFIEAHATVATHWGQFADGITRGDCASSVSKQNYPTMPTPSCLKRPAFSRATAPANSILPKTAGIQSRHRAWAQLAIHKDQAVRLERLGKFFGGTSGIQMGSL